MTQPAHDSAQPQPPTGADRPRLRAGVRLQTDRVTGEPMLLFPEGVVRLNPTGAAILELCDGQRTIDDCVAILATRFRSPSERLRADVSNYLIQLARKGYVCWDNPAQSPVGGGES